GFEKQPAQPGDLFIRFVLNMETANSMVVRKYRETIQQPDKHPRRPIAGKIIYDPHLEEILQNLLEVLTANDIAQHPQLVDTFLPLLDQLAESPQMTLTQQVLLRGIHEVLSQQEVRE
ncbi:MAG TPA: hypothetical protein VKR06_09315, partial [Ktedonosporobacter sp.]|nr:hypothetical protein [Ktedonosporobacter sp.]